MDKNTELHVQKRWFVDIILENKECYIFDTAAEQWSVVHSRACFLHAGAGRDPSCGYCCKRRGERIMKAVKWLDKHFEEILLVTLLFIMMIIMGIQIVARYALGNSLSWSEEITRFCFIWTGFLSISYCVKNSKSIKIEQFVEWFRDDFGGMGVHFFRLVSYLIELALFAYLLPFAYHFVKQSYMGSAASPAVGIPMWIVQSITVISFALAEIRLLQKFINRIQMIRRGEKEQIVKPAVGVY
jgi:TRAP-type C4-dicarboxylate transport system permease small subunit